MNKRNSTAMYAGFATAYDALQEQVDYERWAGQIDRLLRRHAAKPPKRLIDLACGTGAITLPLAALGYRVDGIDRSSDMLAIANQKALAVAPTRRPRFYQMDMTDFALNGECDAVISVCDGGNYLLTDEEMRGMFASAHRQLADEGLFLLDMSSRYKLEEIIGDRTIAESYEDGAFLWENEIDREQHLLYFRLTLFQRCADSERDTFVRHIEDHCQRGYEIEELIELAAPWFECVEVLDGEHFDAVRSDSERVLWILQKKSMR